MGQSNNHWTRCNSLVMLYVPVDFGYDRFIKMSFCLKQQAIT